MLAAASPLLVAAAPTNAGTCPTGVSHPASQVGTVRPGTAIDIDPDLHCHILEHSARGLLSFFQVDDRLLVDGFETGDTRLWDETAGVP